MSASVIYVVLLESKSEKAEEERLRGTRLPEKPHIPPKIGLRRRRDGGDGAEGGLTRA